MSNGSKQNHPAQARGVVKFTPQQVIEMAKAAGLSIDCRNAIDGDEVVQEACWRVITDEITRLCTLAADAALEAAAAGACEQADDEGEGPDSWGWHSKDYAKAIRAMKEKP